MLAVNNLLIGAGSLETAGVGEYRNNFTAQRDDFVDPDRGDYRLRANSPVVGRSLLAQQTAGAPHVPLREYLHPTQSQPLGQGAKLVPGALQSLGPPP